MRVVNVCSNDPNTTVFAHMNEDFAGKGMGQKAHDFAGGIACDKCHDWYDGNNGTLEERRFYVFRSVIRTLKLLFDNGILR